MALLEVWKGVEFVTIAFALLIGWIAGWACRALWYRWVNPRPSLGFAEREIELLTDMVSERLDEINRHIGRIHARSLD